MRERNASFVALSMQRAHLQYLCKDKPQINAPQWRNHCKLCMLKRSNIRSLPLPWSSAVSGGRREEMNGGVEWGGIVCHGGSFFGED